MFSNCRPLEVHPVSFRARSAVAVCIGRARCASMIMLGASVVLGPRLAFLARWQLAPAYAAVIAAALGWWFTATGLMASSLIARLLVPLPDPQGLSGPHSVGVVDLEATLPSGTQPAFGRILYPAATSHSSVASYIAMPASGLSRSFIAIASPPFLRPYLPLWFLDHWNAVTIPAKRGAPPARLASLPVVVFSHGLTASRETSQSLALSLAANGALVVLLEHTDRSGALARRLDGSVIPFDSAPFALGTDPPTEAYLDARRLQTALRVADVRRHFAVLQSVHRGDGEASLRFDGLAIEEGAALLAGLRGRLALSRLALGGHSFGGCTALALAGEMALAARPRRDSPDASRDPPASEVDEGQCQDVDEGQCQDVTLGALFSLDPALEWLPRDIQHAVGHDAGHGQPLGGKRDVSHNNGKRAPPIPRGAPSPALPASGLPLLTVWSEEWSQRGWFRQWSANVIERATHSASHALDVQGCGHQGLCDVAPMLPHRLNLLLRNSLGCPSGELAHRVSRATLAFLRNAGVLEGAAVDLATLDGTMAHRRAGDVAEL